MAFGLDAWKSIVAKITVTLSAPIKKAAHILAFVKESPWKVFKR